MTGSGAHQLDSVSTKKLSIASMASFIQVALGGSYLFASASGIRSFLSHPQHSNLIQLHCPDNILQLSSPYAPPNSSTSSASLVSFSPATPILRITDMYKQKHWRQTSLAGPHRRTTPRLLTVLRAPPLPLPHPRIASPGRLSA